MLTVLRRRRGSKTCLQQGQGIPVLAVGSAHEHFRTNYERRVFPTGIEVRPMHRQPQFAMRENPASERRHGSRAEIRDFSKGDCFQHESPADADPTADLKYSLLGWSTPPNPASLRAATGEKDETRLLTIQQVANILHVPVSWVYGRTRKRSTERLPGIRLGKYWRFREEEIHRWIESQRGGHRVP